MKDIPPALLWSLEDEDSEDAFHDSRSVVKDPAAHKRQCCTRQDGSMPVLLLKLATNRPHRAD